MLSATGEELERFPEAPGPGDNGSPVPFDTPSNATFLGSRVLVANQSFTGDSSHHAILDVYVGERGRAPYLPAGRTGADGRPASHPSHRRHSCTSGHARPTKCSDPRLTGDRNAR